MQYQQKKERKKKEKRRKECSPQRNGKKTMTSFSIKATYCVQRLRRNKQTKKYKENNKRGEKKNPDGIQTKIRNKG